MKKIVLEQPTRDHQIFKKHSGRRNHTSQSADCRTVYI